MSGLPGAARLIGAMLVIGALTGCGGTGHTASPAAVSPEPVMPAGIYTQTIIRHVNATHYVLTVINLSSGGWIDGFTWSPAGTSITAVLDSSSGHCTLSNGAIRCRLIRLHPPTCTCRGDGGRATVDFVMSGDDPTETSSPHPLLKAGRLTIDSVTPVRYVVRSTPLPGPTRVHVVAP